ncbi:hypothetical protein LP414_17610 [Polaromonas sp. P1(28)-13]|nr:hypothetical protein LP414_17610 [Polaromonas sp. P1(28)-13]
MQFMSRVAAIAPVSTRRPPVAEAAPNPIPEAPSQPMMDYVLASQIGAELSAPINTMQGIVQDFAQTRRISRTQMEDLVAAIESASQIAHHSQQIGRLAEGRLRQSHERIRLDELLHQALRDVTPALQAQGIEFRHNIKPVEIIVDPGLLSSLIDASLSWGRTHGQRLMISLSIKNWPEHGMLVIKATSPAGQPSQEPQADSLNWHLLSHIAQTMGVTLEQKFRRMANPDWNWNLPAPCAYWKD